MGARFDVPESTTMLEARALYFAANDFGPKGGYEDKWVKVEIGPIPMFIPNSAERVRAVRYHDLHHVLTGYATDLPGECQISAWEIASGCRDFRVAWALNLMGMAGGVVFCPVATWRAWLRGRRSENLYGHVFDDALLGASVGELRRACALADADASDAPPTAAVRVAFAAAVAAGLVLGTVWLALPLIVLAPFLWWLWSSWLGG